MGASAVSKLAASTDLSQMAGAPAGCTVLQRDLNRQEKTADKEPHEVQQRERLGDPTLNLPRASNVLFERRPTDSFAPLGKSQLADQGGDPCLY